MTEEPVLALERLFPDMDSPVQRIRAALHNHQKLRTLPENVENAVLEQIDQMHGQHDFGYGAVFDLMEHAIQPGRFRVAIALLEKSRSFGLNLINQGGKEQLLRLATHMRSDIINPPGSNAQYHGVDGEAVVRTLRELGALDNVNTLAPATESALRDAGFANSFIEIMQENPSLTFKKPLRMAEFAIQGQHWQLLEMMLYRHPELITDASLTQFFRIGFQGENAQEMVQEFATHFVLPTMVQQMHVDPSALKNKTIRALREEALIIAEHMLMMPYETTMYKLQERMRHNATTLSEAERDAFVRETRRGFALANTYTHPAIALPTKLLPELPEREWHPLFEGTETVDINGARFQIRALSSSAALREESEALNHCVGKSTFAAERCCKGDRHILSIANENGDRISTVELFAESYHPPKFSIKQHRGKKMPPCTTAMRNARYNNYYATSTKLTSAKPSCPSRWK